MNWKWALPAMSILLITACNNGPKGKAETNNPEDDAEKLCNCESDMIRLRKDAPASYDFNKKAEECSKLEKEIEKLCNESNDYRKAYSAVRDECEKKLKEEHDGRMEQYRHE